MYVQTQITVSAPTGKQLRNLYQISSWGTKKIHSIESTVEMGKKKHLIKPKNHISQKFMYLNLHKLENFFNLVPNNKYISKFIPILPLNLLNF